MIDHQRFASLVCEFKTDPESVYNTWFINNADRLKAFSAIRRGVQQVVADIRAGSFPTDFKGSSLEVVLAAITEQKQVFEGAAHAFYWKPKLRIPDIYEDDANKRAFGQCLEACAKATTERQLLREIAALDARQIKGLGPAVANILYFLHPTILPPFNTAIVRGFNRLFHRRNKLGSWPSYLDMRASILEANETFKSLLSKDLGALGGLLFEVGAGKLLVGGVVSAEDEKARARRERVISKRHKQVESELKDDGLHARMQHTLLTIGRALGYDGYVAVNDRSKVCAGERLSFLSIEDLPPLAVADDVRRTIRLIDVIWLDNPSGRIVCAFEVEKSTSIYSGILRLTDLALALPGAELYLVAPDKREKEVLAQLRRPAITAIGDTKVHYILCSELEKHCASLCKLGDDHTIMRKVAKCAR